MAPQLASGARVTADSPSIDILWLDVLHRIGMCVSHELKGALNGVSVNLEVVRSRSEKPDSPASSVHKFAVAAASQLGAVISMSDALLALARPAREPIEIGPLVRRIDALLAPGIHADGRSLELQGPFDELGVTAAPGNAARLVIAAALLAATEGSSHVVCQAITDDADPMVRIECRDGILAPIDGDIASAVAEVGIRVHTEESTIVISFPR